MGHGFEVGPKFFEIHGFTQICGFLTHESKKSNVVLMGNTQFFMSNLSWQLFCEAWFLRNTLFFMSNLLWSLISKKGMVFLVKFAMPNLLWSLISKKYTVFHVKFVMTTMIWSLISKKYTFFSCQTCNANFAVKLYFSRKKTRFFMSNCIPQYLRYTAHWSKGYPKNQTPFCIIFGLKG